MRLQEARYLADSMAALGATKLSPCVNIGSSTRAFREIRKPHIAGEFFAPLEREGLRFVHADMKLGDGIDIAGDLLNGKVQDRIRDVGARSILLTNVLEHVVDPGQLARICLSFVADGGYIVVSVPRSYPYHSDPIDTGYRPLPVEIAELFPGTVLRISMVLEAGSALDDWRAKGALTRYAARRFVRLCMPFYKPRVWLHHAHELFWLWRPYLISVAILQKSDQRGSPDWRASGV